jgi:putative aminopeptidase FrvX
MPITRFSAIQRKILTELLSIPTAPFAEHQVIAHILRFCERFKHVTVKRDAVGNILVRVKSGKRTIRRPVCITAHLDHPGFVSAKMIGKNRVRAFWRGGVPKEYFVGSRVQFDVDSQWVKGTIKSIKTKVSGGVDRVQTVVAEVKGEVPPRSIGMWDFPDPVIRGQRIHARACDDLAGAGAMLSAIEELCRSKQSCDAYFLFTRAEEVGFIGAIAACRLKTIPKKCFVVAMETSSELANAKMGDGPILRVGDRASAFTHATTAYCHRIARDLQLSDKRFSYQRKLMDGGTCESSAFCRLGYEATGLCVALGNYHNVNAAKKKLGPEYIDLGDFASVVKWFVELARAPYPYEGRDPILDATLTKLERSYQSLLRASVKGPR